ncbi:MAG: GntR family transcriptional regulator, partial [Planctomycetota bacterium]
MYIRLDHSSGEPFYRQIVEQVKYAVAAARVVPGDRLPSIRGLAGRLKINPRTVVKAYEELAHAGLVVMRQGQGA